MGWKGDCQLVISGVGMATSKVAMGIAELKEMKEELSGQLECAAVSRPVIV